jgi:hypothetical protein
MANVHALDPYKVTEIQTLGLADDKVARELLDQIALQVQPVMRKRSFKVPLLKEFLPANPGLLVSHAGRFAGPARAPPTDPTAAAALPPRPAPPRPAPPAPGRQTAPLPRASCRA